MLIFLVLSFKRYSKLNKFQLCLYINKIQFDTNRILLFVVTKLKSLGSFYKK